jgi:hypothetical protein
MVEDIANDLAGLTHDIFVGRVVNNVKRESPTAMLFQNAGTGDYHLEGQAMKFATDLRFKTGAMATSGKIPDHIGMDAIKGTLTPIRRYARIALDNFVEKRASGPGSFDDLSGRIFDQLWDSWKSMEIRHAIGGSTGLLCKIHDRSDDHTFTVKDAFGHAGTNPLSNISEGSIICWYDMTHGGIEGAARVHALDYATLSIEVDSAATWEPGDQIAENDLVYFATTNAIGTDYFESERNLAPNGLGVILDPDADYTTVFGISETDYPRWKPFRKSSVTCDHLEFTEFWLKLAGKRGFGVSPATDVVVTYPAVVAQVARSLMGFQQQTYTGEGLKGGYTSVTVGGIPFVEDHFFYHNVAMTLCKQNLFRINLGADADFWGEDGSMWSRIADFDGKEAFVVDYLNTLCVHRGANGALTGITTDVTSADFDNTPNY